MVNVAIIQQEVPHYRQEFFDKMDEFCNVDLYIYHGRASVLDNKMPSADVATKSVGSTGIGLFLI